jgi:hypothetical protein
MSNRGSQEDDRYRELQGQKIEPPETTRNDKIRFAIFFIGIAVAIIVILVVLLVKD